MSGIQVGNPVVQSCCMPASTSRGQEPGFSESPSATPLRNATPPPTHSKTATDYRFGPAARSSRDPDCVYRFERSGLACFATGPMPSLPRSAIVSPCKHGSLTNGLIGLPLSLGGQIPARSLQSPGYSHQAEAGLQGSRPADLVARLVGPRPGWARLRANARPRRTQPARAGSAGQ